MGYNPEVRRKSYLKNKAKVIEYSTHYNRLKRAGITKEEYLALHKSQNGLCAICGKSGTKALAIDHDHETGILRELLCGNCNRALGYFKDDKSILYKAYKYLDKWKLK